MQKDRRDDAYENLHRRRKTHLDPILSDTLTIHLIQGGNDGPYVRVLDEGVRWFGSLTFHVYLDDFSEPFEKLPQFNFVGILDINKWT